MTTLTISCDDCLMQGTDACDGCLVSFICDREPDDAVVIDVEEERALRMLGRSGLTPPLRHNCRHIHSISGKTQWSGANDDAVPHGRTG